MRASPVEIDWHTGLSIYSSESYLKTVSKEYGWIGGIENSGTLRCVLPYCVMRRSMFRLIRFTCETIVLAGEMGVEDERDFLDHVVEYFRSAGADLIIPATFNSLFRTYPDGSLAAPYGSHVIDLSQPEETLWNNLHQKHRNVIRNAIKKGLKIQNGIEHVDTANTLVRDSFRRSTKGFLNTLRLRIRMDDKSIKRQALGLGDHVKIFIAEYEGVIQGCAVIPFSSYCAYYMHGGSIAEPLTGAMNLLQWEAMRFFRELGVRYYNFVGARIDPEPGSKQAGLSMFKQRFGGELKRGYMWKYSFHPLKSAAYSLAVRLLRGGDIVDQERHKLKNV